MVSRLSVLLVGIGFRVRVCLLICCVCRLLFCSRCCSVFFVFSELCNVGVVVCGGSLVV